MPGVPLVTTPATPRLSQEGYGHVPSLAFQRMQKLGKTSALKPIPTINIWEGTKPIAVKQTKPVKIEIKRIMMKRIEVFIILSY